MRYRLMIIGLFCFVLLLGAGVFAQEDEFVFGMILVGPKDDQGWSQAHFEGGRFVEDHVENTRMIFFESLNPADSPDDSLLDVVTDMVDDGAQLIFTTSDAFEDDTDEVALEFPDVTFINISGDHALTGEAPPNVGNIMGQMEWGKQIAGCAAALTTETGHIGYLGPLINNETRRLASSAYLGARFCYEHFAGEDPDDLIFDVTWIGFWFNVPGVTLDPVEETNTFFDAGADVVISGIDTTEAITVAAERAAAGEDVFVLPYDFSGACSVAEAICLGVPYFNWGPAYVEVVEQVRAGEWEQSWLWLPPDWSDLNNLETSAIGFVVGDGLDRERQDMLNQFIADLANYATNPFVPDSLALWSGPLMLRDGSVLAGDGELVSPLDIWYLPQVLAGMNEFSG
ncbi:MAG: BMP family ABC transporter substrate-binding protein [Chloroflexi bacterium]|nr:MAG: BMP family ABC transporter substrate-binding protein [Chloroflexota bacterium]